MIHVLLIEQDVLTFTFKGDLYHVKKTPTDVVLSKVVGNRYVRAPMVSDAGLAIADYLKANAIDW